MSIVVRISSDKMAATVEVERQTEAPFQADAIKSALAEAGVQHGVDDGACNKLAESVNRVAIGQRIIHQVAIGAPPIDGTDGRIEMVVEYDRNPVGVLRDSGSMDFHERGSFTPIAKGQLIARIVPPTPGTPGKNVYGEEITPNPGKSVRLTAGQGTRLEAKGAELRAARPGDLRCVDGRIEVMDMIRVSGDLNYAVGSIECEGPVRVEGDVLPGFHIRAGGDVWISGVVDSAEVSSNGNVVAQGVLRGSRILAKHNIAVGYARESYLESGGSIKIATEAVNTTVVAAETIAVADNGRVVGGRLLAQKRIEAGTAGHPKGIPTMLVAGVDPYNELRAAKLAAKLNRAESVEARIGGMKSLAPPTQHERLDQLLSRESSKRQQHAEELSELKQKNIPLTDCRIVTKRNLHSGVSVRIGPAEMTIKEDQQGATFYYDADSGEVVEVSKAGEK